jgi:hypothetical protein
LSKLLKKLNESQKTKKTIQLLFFYVFKGVGKLVRKPLAVWVKKKEIFLTLKFMVFAGNKTKGGWSICQTGIAAKLDSFVSEHGSAC